MLEEGVSKSKTGKLGCSVQVQGGGCRGGRAGGSPPQRQGFPVQWSPRPLSALSLTPVGSEKGHKNISEGGYVVLQSPIRESFLK